MRLGGALGIAAATGAAVAGGMWLWRHQGEVAMSRPINEWTFTHMNRVMPSEPVHRASRPSPLPVAADPLPVHSIRYEYDGREYGLDELHRRTHTTGFLILHRGEVLHESYPGRVARADARFQLFSLTKSVTSMLVGIALERGEIGSLDDGVVDYLPELAGSGYDGVVLEQLLDMRSGVGGVEAALGGGSLNASLRDTARVGAIMADGGRIGDTRLVPENWVARSRGSSLPQLQVGALESGGYPHYGYSNQWWTLGGERRAFTALGVHGQYLWVDPDSNTVIVKTSAWQDADDAGRDLESCIALAAVVRAVESR